VEDGAPDAARAAKPPYLRSGGRDSESNRAVRLLAAAGETAQQQVNAGRAARDCEATTKRYEGRALDAGLRLSAILEAMTISSC
jgi:hypothetical protein